MQVIGRSPQSSCGYSILAWVSVEETRDTASFELAAALRYADGESAQDDVLPS
jgi:hypothetical protein